MKIVIVCISIIFLSVDGWSQWHPVDGSCGKYFVYDNAGNRTRRYACNVTRSLTQEESGSVTSKHLEKREAVADLTEMVVFPNPSRGRITVETQVIEASARLLIYDEAGRTMHDGVLGDGDFDLSDYSAGVYYIILRTKERTLTTKLIRTN